MTGNLRTLIHNLGVVIVRNPVEILVSLAAFLLSVLLYEKILAEYVVSDNPFLAPVIFAIPYILNRINSKKIIFPVLYFLSALSILIFFCKNTASLFETGVYPVLLIIALAAVASFRNIKDNRLFVDNFLRFFKNLIFALISAGAATLLLMALTASVIYLFDVFKESSDDIYFYIANISIFVAAPLVFLYLDHEWESGKSSIKDFNISGISDIVINYILSPALILYTLILYVYIAVVAVTWSLPKGNVAIMVIGFIITAFSVKALLPLLDRQNFKGFFRYLSYISVLPIILFWIGIIYRIRQYGFTEERVYLLVTGAIITYTVFEFLKERPGSYLRIGYTVLIAGALFTFMPWISARDIGIRSQRNRLEAIVVQLGMTISDGKISFPASFDNRPESEKMEQICDIMDYLKVQWGREKMSETYGFSDGKEFKKAVENLSPQ